MSFRDASENLDDTALEDYRELHHGHGSLPDEMDDDEVDAGKVYSLSVSSLPYLK